MHGVVSFVAYGIVLVLVHEALRRGGRWLAWTLFLALPAALIPWWLHLDNAAYGLFPWVKLGSVLFTAAWVARIRFAKSSAGRRSHPEIELLLAANILEAVFQDFVAGGLPNILNGVAGTLLILSIRYASPAAVGGNRNDLRMGSTSRGWIAAYTVWNLTFVLAHFPNIGGQQAAVLLAAFAVGMLNPRLWGQARVHTLAISLLIVFTIPGARTGWLDLTGWFDESWLTAFASVGLAATVIAVVPTMSMPRIAWPRDLFATALRRAAG